MDGAGTALPVIASLVRAEQLQPAVQNVEQRFAWIEFYIDLLPVHDEYRHEIAFRSFGIRWNGQRRPIPTCKSTASPIAFSVV